MNSLSVTKLHLVYICARFHPFKGGAEQNALQLALRMAAAGHQVTVLTTDASTDNTPLPQQENYSGINIVRLHRWNQQLNLGFYPGLLPKLLSLKADVIHYENGPGFIWQEWCLLAKRLTSRKTKFIATPHGGFLVSDNHLWWQKPIVKTARLVGKIYFRLIWSWLFHKVIAVNGNQHIWMQRDLGINKSKISILPNGIPSDYLAATKPEITSPEVVITTLGRISKYKGSHLVVQALGQVHQINPELRFRYKIMGRPDPNFAVTLNTTIAAQGLENLVDIIPDPTDTLRDNVLLNESEISVLFSEWEATGIVLLEAMAKGNAVITSDTNEAAAEIITDGQNGYTVGYPDVTELAKRLERLLGDRELRKNMGMHSRMAAENFTWESIFPKYTQLIDSLYATN